MVQALACLTIILDYKELLLISASYLASAKLRSTPPSDISIIFQTVNPKSDSRDEEHGGTDRDKICPIIFSSRTGRHADMAAMIVYLHEELFKTCPLIPTLLV